MPDSNEHDIMASLGLTDAGEAKDTFKVVYGSVETVSPDVALMKVRQVNKKPYQAIMPVTEFPQNQKWAKDEKYQLLQMGENARPVVSATRPELVEALFDGVSPEVRGGAVRVMGIARAAGVRTKIAVASTQENVDPVASLVGRGANRVKAVSEVLNGERIDVVAWHENKETFLRNALAPAAIGDITIDETTKEATATAPQHQMSAAVGGGGLNSALAGQLVGLKVTITQE